MALDREYRTRLGLLIAPLATVPILSLVGATTQLDEQSVAELVPNVLHISFFFALFGLPVAYFAEALLVLLARRFGKSPGSLPWRAVLAIGTSAGAGVFALLGLESLRAWMAFAATGALMGGGASLLFILIRGRATPPRVAS